VQQLRDPRGDGVPLDAHPGGLDPAGCGGHEDARAAAWFEDLAVIESQAAQDLAADGGQTGRGVERVRGGLLGFPELAGSQQPFKPLPDLLPCVFTAGGEGRSHRPPAGPAPQFFQVGG
jgi:hypothetical protein